MNKKLLWGALIILVLGGIFLTIKNTPGKAQEETVKIGIMVPLTSQYGSVAEGVKNAALLAVSDWGKTHPGMTVDVVVEDDAYQATKGIAAYNKLKNIDHVNGIVSISTPVVDALYQTYQKDGLPVINLGVQTEGATQDNIFQIFPDAKGQVKPLADYLQNKTAYDSIAIIHATNDPAYAQFYDEFVKLYTKPFTDVVLNTKEDSKTVANKTVSKKPGAVVIIVAPALGAAVTRELTRLGAEGMDYYYDASLITGFAEYKTVLGDTTVLNGATTIKTVLSDASAFKASYKATYGIDPVIFAENGYDSMMIILNSYNKNNATWVRNIERTTYGGPSGETRFDDRGIRIPEYIVTSVVDGAVQ